MTRTLSTSSTALVLSLVALTAANAGTFNTAEAGKVVQINSSLKPFMGSISTVNTVPLNTQGHSVSSTPVVYGGVNTTINSSINPYVVPGSKPVVLNTTPLNTQGKSVPSTPVVYGLTNSGNFATPNVKATIATGPIPTPKPGSTTPIYGSDSSGPTVGDSLASLTDLAQTNNSVSSINTTQSINPARLISANDQTFTNPSFAKGLTNLDFNALSAANATKGTITVDPTNPPKPVTGPGAPSGSSSGKGSVYSTVGATLGAPTGGASTNTNGQTGAGSSGMGTNATTANAALLASLGDKIGSGARTIAGSGSSDGSPSPSWVASATGNAPITSDVPIDLNTAVQQAKTTVQQGQTTVINLSKIQNSIPPELQVQLPGPTTITAADQTELQNIAKAWLITGTVAAGGVYINGVRIANASIVQPVGSIPTTGGLNLGLGGGGQAAADTAAGGNAGFPNFQAVKNAIQSLIGPH
jgi:hypothetical protein